jgi:hypothetical protein
MEAGAVRKAIRPWLTASRPHQGRSPTQAASAGSSARRARPAATRSRAATQPRTALAAVPGSSQAIARTTPPRTDARSTGSARVAPPDRGPSGSPRRGRVAGRGRGRAGADVAPAGTRPERPITRCMRDLPPGREGENSAVRCEARWNPRSAGRRPSSEAQAPGRSIAAGDARPRASQPAAPSATGAILHDPDQPADRDAPAPWFDLLHPARIRAVWDLATPLPS